MVYFCTECNKYHADNYKRHLRYKKVELVTRKEEPDLFTKLEEDFEAFKQQLEKYCKDVDKIKETMGIWALYIQRKHPYWKMDEEWMEWIND